MRLEDEYHYAMQQEEREDEYYQHLEMEAWQSPERDECAAAGITF